jgi:hypothetical protein
MIAISRIILNNVRNIQASILTVGKQIGMLSLHSGANDLGSIMIEENVVSAAGSQNRFNAIEMQSIIKEAGFVPGRRNQKYELVNVPPPPHMGGSKNNKKVPHLGDLGGNKIRRFKRMNSTKNQSYFRISLSTSLPLA